MPERTLRTAAPLRIVTALLLAVAWGGACSQTRWVICDLSVHVDEVQRAAQRMAGRVAAVKAPAGAQCPRVDERISFLPETPDYQSVLPRRRWPKVGAVARVRYRYLIGSCKHAEVCKIEHHSVLP